MDGAAASISDPKPRGSQGLGKERELKLRAQLEFWNLRLPKPIGRA